MNPPPQHHPVPLGLKIIVALGIVLGVVSVILGANNARLRGDDRDELNELRNQDRVASDISACERGNRRAVQTREGFVAVDEAIQGILDVFLGAPRPGTEAQVAALKERLEAPLSKLDFAVEAIKITDCQKAVPGARSLP